LKIKLDGKHSFFPQYDEALSLICDSQAIIFPSLSSANEDVREFPITTLSPIRLFQQNVTAQVLAQPFVYDFCRRRVLHSVTVESNCILPDRITAATDLDADCGLWLLSVNSGLLGRQATGCRSLIRAKYSICDKKLTLISRYDIPDPEPCERKCKCDCDSDSSDSCHDNGFFDPCSCHHHHHHHNHLAPMPAPIPAPMPAPIDRCGNQIPGFEALVQISKNDFIIFAENTIIYVIIKDHVAHTYKVSLVVDGCLFDKKNYSKLRITTAFNTKKGIVFVPQFPERVSKSVFLINDKEIKKIKKEINGGKKCVNVDASILKICAKNDHHHLIANFCGIQALTVDSNNTLYGLSAWTYRYMAIANAIPLSWSNVDPSLIEIVNILPIDYDQDKAGTIITKPLIGELF
jgi:hypothetical protein